jgi:hypothetical protein
MFEDTEAIMRIGKSNKDNTMAKRKRTNNDLKSIHLKLKIDLHDNVILPFFKQEPLLDLGFWEILKPLNFYADRMVR